MLQTLFYLPAEVSTPWGDLPLFGAGLLVAVWGLFSLGFLAWLIFRHGLSSETWGHLPLLALIGAAIYFVLPMLVENDPATQQPRGLPIRGYGVMLLAAVTCGVGLADWRARRAGLSSDTIHSLALWMFLAGFGGARLFYVIQYWEQFQHPTLPQTLAAMVNVAQGGLVVYGSAIGAAVAFVLFAHRRRLPVLALGDLVAPSLMVGLALGRVGCFLNGCCYGGLTDLPWSVQFPGGSPPHYRQVERGQVYGLQIVGVAGGDRRTTLEPVLAAVAPNSPAASSDLEVGQRVVEVDGEKVSDLAAATHLMTEVFLRGEKLEIATGDPLRGPATYRRATLEPLSEARSHSLPVHPTQLYSTINALLLLGLLLAYEPFRRRDGELVALLFTLYPISRFLIEMIRTDEPPMFGTGFSISQNISLLVLAATVCLWGWLVRRPPGLTWTSDIASSRQTTV